MKFTQFKHYTTFLLLINFRVQFEEKVTTTEHSVKETCRERGYVTTESSSTYVIIYLATITSVIFVSFLIFVFIWYKRCGRCNQLRNGKSLSIIQNTAFAIQMQYCFYYHNHLEQVFVT